MTRQSQTRILFVRAVNVGGVALPMQEFRTLLAELGGVDVRTYIASGNAVVRVPGDPDVFDRAVEREMTNRFGWFREVISRTPEEVEEALTAYPFEVPETKYAYVTFLAGTPETAGFNAALAIDTGDDVWQLEGRDLYIRYAHGAGKADPGIAKVMRRLGVPGTARNLNTVRNVLDLAKTSRS